MSIQDFIASEKEWKKFENGYHYSRLRTIGLSNKIEELKSFPRDRHGYEFRMARMREVVDILSKHQNQTDVKIDCQILLRH